MNYRRKNKLSLHGIGLLAAWLTLASLNASGADGDRGRMLHDTHCISCHGTQVYKRDSKLGKDYETIRKQVLRWETNLALKWTDDDIDAVTAYLARAFYKVPCPSC